MVPPESLSEPQLQQWQRRQSTAESTLEIQALSGTAPDAETLEQFRRYVRGEITLAQAIERVRMQLAQAHSSFRAHINRQDRL